jgi:MFS family permease
LFYGWVVVFVSFVLISLIFGVRLSFGIFFDALTRSGEFDWTRADTAGVFSVTMLVFTLFGAPVGWLLDRLGPRRLYILGLLVMASGLAMTSRMTNLTEFYLLYGVWTGLGITILGLSVHAATLSRWFDRAGRRGLAIGLAFSGTGIGILILAPVLERTIALVSWRAAFVLLAVLLLGLGLPLTLLLLRDRPEDLGLSPDGVRTAANPGNSQIVRDAGTPTRIQPPQPLHLWTWGEAIHTPVFWLIMVSGALSLFTLRMVTVHQVSHFVDNGIPRFTAATVFGSSGFITALTFIVFGTLSDRIGRERTFYIGSAAQISAILLLIFLRPGASMPFLYAYALLWGIGEGSRSGLLTAFASDTFPGPALGAIVGSLGAFFGFGAAVGSWFGGLIFDWSGSYVLAFELALVATVMATVSVGIVRRMK